MAAAITAPTFAGTAICDASQRESDGSLGVRIHVENLPGADGEFAQPQGHGGRTIVVRGTVVCVDGDTPADALDTGHVTLRAKQAVFCDGKTIGDFVDSANRTHSNCIMLSYEPTGPMTVVPNGEKYRSIISIRAVVRELAP